jgi:chemotaxis protein MotB
MLSFRLSLFAAMGLVLASCSHTINFTDPTAYLVRQQKLGAFTGEAAVASDDFVSLRVQKICLGEKADDFDPQDTVVVGIKVRNLSAWDATKGAWQPVLVRRTPLALGKFKEGCVEIQPVYLGEYRYIEQGSFEVSVVLRVVEDLAVASRIGALLARAAASEAATFGSGDQGNSEIQSLAYSELISPYENNESIPTFHSKLTFDRRGQGANIIPVAGQTVIVGTLDGSPEKPEPKLVEVLKAKADGKVLLGDKPFLRSPYLTVEVNKLGRNPYIRPQLKRDASAVMSLALNTQHANQAALVALEVYTRGIEDAVSKGNVARQEALYLQNANQCMKEWKALRETDTGRRILTNEISKELATSASPWVIRIRKACSDFHATSDVFPYLAEAEIDPSETPTEFKPYGAESRMRIASSELLRLLDARLELALGLADYDKLNRELNLKAAELTQKATALTDAEKANQEYAARIAELEKVRQRFKSLKDKLGSLKQFGIDVVVRNNMLVVNMPGDVLFPSGQYTLNKKGQEVVLEVAKVIRGDAELERKRFQVAGHTDAVKLKGSKGLLDNMHLSLMRARDVQVLLTKPLDKGGGGLEASNISAAGFGDTMPLNDNSTKELQGKNRRVELVLQPDLDKFFELGSLD